MFAVSVTVVSFTVGSICILLYYYCVQSAPISTYYILHIWR